MKPRDPKYMYEENPFDLLSFIERISKCIYICKIMKTVEVKTRSDGQSTHTCPNKARTWIKFQTEAKRTKEPERGEKLKQLLRKNCK